MLTPYSNIISVQTSCFVGILDTYPNAAVAYSVRRLATAYTGPLLRVRRSSDNTEQDIGYTTLGDLDETALTNFVGANNGFVTTWYDQSGNANNATQSTAANQPQIVSSGAVIKVNGKVATDYNSANILFFTINNTIAPKNDFFIYSVGERTTTAKTYSPFGTTGIFGYISNNVLYVEAKEAWSGSTNTQTGQLLMLCTANLNDYKFYQNDIQQILIQSQPSGYNATYTYINCWYFTPQTGMIQEGIIWNTNKTSDKTGITSNINTYYGIF
jgi:hypothetical protein